MADNSLENLLEKQTAEIEKLKTRITIIEEQLASGLAATYTATALEDTASPPENSEPAAPAGDDFWTWLGKASLLPRIASVSFTLVIALLLRTLTNSEIIARHTGSVIGVAYAIGLIFLGWRLIAGKNRIGPVFPMSGGILMFIIILETHARFAAISSPVAYSILLATMAAMVAIGHNYEFPLLASVGIIGASCCTFILDFQTPNFLVQACFLLIANLAAFLVANKPDRKELTRWTMLFTTGVFWTHWLIVLYNTFDKKLAVPTLANPNWFVPLIAAYTLAFFLMTVHRGFRLKQLTILDTLIPTVTGLTFYMMTQTVLIPWLHIETTVGAGGIIWAAILFTTAFFATRKTPVDAVSANTFTVASVAVFLAAAPTITQNLLIAISLWSIGALLLLKLSWHSKIGGIRLSSYLLQIIACATGVLSGAFAIQHADISPFTLTVTTAMMLLSGFHYYMSRKKFLVAGNGFFGIIDKKDYSAIAMLIASLTYGFYMLQQVAMLIITPDPADFNNIITGLRSIFINGGAFLLILMGIKNKNKDLLGTALAVFIVGAAKVFGYDLFEISGVPLVLSVFSFGAAAALGSLALSRWQKQSPATETSS
ncbi:MAG: hypothetical protein OEY01_02005 [Desulfobulbaceae bacterium]|nr:hypothetical protein [Desulfobulbaceae bacterium]HIJ78066.1 hypothetical protein [Deltaproteobacteria bacterium]